MVEFRIQGFASQGASLRLFKMKGAPRSGRQNSRSFQQLTQWRTGQALGHHSPPSSCSVQESCLQPASPTQEPVSWEGNFHTHARRGCHSFPQCRGGAWVAELETKGQGPLKTTAFLEGLPHRLAETNHGLQDKFCSTAHAAVGNSVLSVPYCLPSSSGICIYSAWGLRKKPTMENSRR